MSQLFTAIVGLCLVQGCSKVGDSKVAELAYLGQPPPGRTPVVFASGLVSTEHVEFGITFSPDGKEMYFTRRRSREEGNRILGSRVDEGAWTAVGPAPFGMDCQESEPNFSPDGRRLFFNSRRPLPEDVVTPNPMNVWIVEKVGDGWGNPVLVAEPIRAIIPMFVTATDEGSLYTTGNVERGIYRSIFMDGNYSEPVRLPEAVNGRHWAGHPYVAPDESYVIFDANMDAEGTKNLFVSSMDENGEWTDAVNLSEHLGFEEHSWCPFVSFDGEYFFFSARQDVYWVDASVFEMLKPEE